MIATAALAAYLFAEANFSRSGHRKATGGVLDDGGGRSIRRLLACKSGFSALDLFRKRRKVGGIIRYDMREMKFIV